MKGQPATVSMTPRWTQAFEATLDEATLQLQFIVFEERWDDIRATVESDEDGLRQSLLVYETELGRLLELLRISGYFADPVAWSEQKQRLRKDASEVDINLRTALENGCYVAEASELGRHADFLAWLAALECLLTSLPAEPRPTDPDEMAQLAWAYRTLAPIEEPETFHTSLLARMTTPALTELEQHLFAHPRYDLLMNAGLSWLAFPTNSP